MGNENYVFTMLYTDRREHVFFDKIQFEKLWKHFICAKTKYGKRSFSYKVLWNELPQNVQAISSLSQFEREIDNLQYTPYETDSRTGIL
jgi:hypothetical protein